MELKHSGTVQLETQRLILRQFVIDDAQNMYDNWAADDEVTKFLTWPSHPDVEETINVIKYWIGGYSTNQTYDWAVILKEIQQPIGSIGLLNINNNQLSCEIGYCIGKKYWGKGIIAEALIKIFGYLFDDVGFNRIEAKHDILNPNSGKAMQKAGMSFEGTLREAGIDRQGQFYSCNIYSILKSDWKTLYPHT